MTLLLQAQLCILDYLHRSANGRTVREILDHLYTHTLWGEEQLASGSQDSGLRTVQGWLKSLSGSTEFGGLIRSQQDPDDRRRLLYAIVDKSAAEPALPVEEAMLIALAERHLGLFIPEEFRAVSLNKLFARARGAIERYERHIAPDRPAVSTYLDSIAVQSRGQALLGGMFPHERLATLSTALLHRRCIDTRYSGRARLLHPCAMVVRDPKLYLIAVEDPSTSPERDPQPKVYLGNRFEAVKLSTRRRIAPQININSFIRAGRLEKPLCNWEGHPQYKPIELCLLLHPAANEAVDHLIDDLYEHPLSADQQITHSEDESLTMLTCSSVVPTEALVSWIVGRCERVEVVSPPWLRRLITERIDAVRQLYHRAPPALF